MKFIFLILLLAAITAGSTYFVAPQLREFHEGYLKQNVIKKLENSKAGYIDVEVEMNHLHAEKIQINKIASEGETEDSIRDEVVEIVRSVYGATTEPNAVTVNFEFAPNKPKAPEVKPAKLVEKVEPKIEPMPDIAVEPEPEVDPQPMPEPEPQPEPEPVLVSSEIYVEWNERKNEIRVDGKLSNNSQKDAFISMLKKKYKSAVITDNLLVDKDEVAESGRVLDLQNHLAKIIEANNGKGSVKIVDQPASLTITGTLKGKADFESLNKDLLPLTKPEAGKPLKVVNKLMYHPEFVIEKDDKQRAIVLSGYASRNDSVNLSSYIKRFTGDGTNQYEFKSDIVPDKRSAEYIWTEADQILLDNQLKNAVRGKIYFENDMVSKVTGVTAVEDYYKTLKERFTDKATEIELVYDENAMPQTPRKDRTGLAEAEAKKEQLEAAKKLRTELKEYKIYYASGSKDVDAKFDPVIKEIAGIILKSEDKVSKIVIGGFADHTGNAASNEKLSKERATSVQLKLVELGVPITRTVVEFFGAEGADVDKALSRRVEIRVR